MQKKLESRMEDQRFQAMVFRGFWWLCSHLSPLRDFVFYAAFSSVFHFFSHIRAPTHTHTRTHCQYEHTHSYTWLAHSSLACFSTWLSLSHTPRWSTLTLSVCPFSCLQCYITNVCRIESLNPCVQFFWLSRLASSSVVLTLSLS